VLKEAGFVVKGRGLGEVYQGRGNLILLKVKGFMLSRLVIAFLPRSKRLLISWLQSQSAVILELKK